MFRVTLRFYALLQPHAVLQTYPYVPAHGQSHGTELHLHLTGAYDGPHEVALAQHLLRLIHHMYQILYGSRQTAQYTQDELNVHRHLNLAALDHEG